MGQVTIHLDNETERKLRSMVKNSGMSMSSWIARVVRDLSPEGSQPLAGG